MYRKEKVGVALQIPVLHSGESYNIQILKQKFYRNFTIERRYVLKLGSESLCLPHPHMGTSLAKIDKNNTKNAIIRLTLMLFLFSTNFIDGSLSLINYSSSFFITTVLLIILVISNKNQRNKEILIQYTLLTSYYFAYLFIFSRYRTFDINLVSLS